MFRGHSTYRRGLPVRKGDRHTSPAMDRCAKGPVAAANTHTRSPTHTHLPLPERLGGIDKLTSSGHHSQRCCFHTDRPTHNHTGHNSTRLRCTRYTLIAHAQHTIAWHFDSTYEYGSDDTTNLPNLRRASLPASSRRPWVPSVEAGWLESTSTASTCTASPST